jgi:chromate transporter
MMQDEVVVKKKWLNNQQFLDLLGATNLIPGPNSTEMAIHIGRKSRLERTCSCRALLYCSCSPTNRILPTVIKNMVNYLSYNLLYGIKPAIIAVILGLFILGEKVVENRFTRNHCRLCFTIVTIANQRNCFALCAGL